MNELLDVAAFVANVLKKTGVKYAVFGGIAAGVLGRPRATSDVDVIIDITPSDVDKFLDEIEAAGLKISRRTVVEEELKIGLPAKIIWDEKFSFDIRLSQYGIDVSAIDDAESVSVFGLKFFIVPPEELIVYKLARFNGLDRSDIKNIVAVQSKALDWEYMKELATELAKESGIQKIVENFDLIESKMRRKK